MSERGAGRRALRRLLREGGQRLPRKVPDRGVHDRGVRRLPSLAAGLRGVGEDTGPDVRKAGLALEDGLDLRRDATREAERDEQPRLQVAVPGARRCRWRLSKKL